MLRWSMVCITLLLSTLTAPAHAEPQACALRCEQQQSDCERREGPRANCATEGLLCKRGCQPEPAVEKPIAQKDLRVCEQRCDLNRSTCEDANPQKDDFCAAGQKTCRERCR